MHLNQSTKAHQQLFFLFNKSVLFLFYFSVSDSGVGGDVASG